MKFYDLEPDGKNESHYLCCNGERIARYNTLALALAARESFLLDEVRKFETER